MRRKRRAGGISKNVLSFSDKKVSKNAIFTLLLGLVCLLGFVLLITASVITSGHLGMVGGVIGCIIVILAFFGVLWGLASYDDMKTSQNFKIPGICINIVVIFLGITFIMLKK